MCIIKRYGVSIEDYSKAQSRDPKHIIFSRGVTFMEMIVVSVILSVILGTVLYFMVIARDSLSIANAKITLQQDLRRCLTKMVEETTGSTIDNLEDQNGQPLNFVQRDNTKGILQCIPQDSECVYYTIKFKKPVSWNNQGKISGWSDDIVYRLSSDGITRQEGDASAVTLVGNINLVSKPSGHGYNNDPNALGSGFERLTSNRLKISLVAHRENHGRTVRIGVGSVVYLRNQL